MDGVAKLSGRKKGCAVLLQEKGPLTVHNHCVNHDLNLVLAKRSKVPEIHVILDSLKQLGICFKYSPKRCRRFEDYVQQHNTTLPKNKKITKKIFKMFCETRWVEKTLYLKTFRKYMSQSYNVLKVLHQQLVGMAIVAFRRQDF